MQFSKQFVLIGLPREGSEGTVGVLVNGSSLLFCLNIYDRLFEVVELMFSCKFLVGIHVV